MKVLVTGANGFLGRHVVNELLRRGHMVRAIVRPAARLIDLRWPGEVDLHFGDLRTSPNLGAAFEDIDVVIHLAAAVQGSEDIQFASSVVGTERLLDAMSQSATKRLVLASSLSVYAWARVRRVLNETSPVEHSPDLYTRDGYAVAKAWQESVARRMAEMHGWDLTVIRPGFIWGRGNAYFAGLGQKLGRVHLVFGPRTRLPMTYVENCASLFVTAAEDPRAAGETFNAIDDDKVRIYEHLGEHLQRSGDRGIRIPIPYVLGFAVAKVAQMAVRAAFHGKGKLPSILVPCRFEARFKPLRFDTRKVREVLGWSAPLNREECLRRTYN
jgi:2-alkyl-3-oxoalkanoate reductase